MDRKLRILSIDHDRDFQLQLQRALENEYQITTVMSGLSGIEAMCKEHPDAILLDVDIPIIDGIKICRMIRSEPSFDRTPILLVVNNDNPDSQLQAFSAGGNDCIQRHFTFEDLKNKLNLNIHRLQYRYKTGAASNDFPGLDQNLELLHNYLIKLLKVENSDQLASLTLRAIDSLGLKGAICFHPPLKKIFSSVGPLTDLEQLLIQQARQPYPSEYSARFVWGATRLAALVQNMPSPKSEQYQALVDILATLFKAANEKLSQLLSLIEPRDQPKQSQQNTHSLDLQQLNQQKQRLAGLISQIEDAAEDSLSRVCNHLQQSVNRAHTETPELKERKNLFSQCVKTRVKLFDQCLEASMALEELTSAYKPAAAPKEQSFSE